MKFLGKPISGTLCLWPSTIVKKSEYKEFAEYIIDEVGGGKLTDVTILGGYKNNRGGDDFYFTIHGDVGKFMLNRLEVGIKWYDDWVSSNKRLTYTIDGEKIRVGDLVTE